MTLEHSEISWAVRTGYPSWNQDREDWDDRSDEAYEESRERDLFGE